MDRQPASGTAGLRRDNRTHVDDVPLENDEVVDTGESKGNVAFCITLWLAGERFGASSAACAAASSQGWSTSPVKSGSLANDIDKAVDDMDEELPVAELVMKGTAFLQKLLDMPKEKLAEDLYYVDTLVSIKGPSSLQNVQENMKDVYEEATAAMQNKDFERAAVRICYKFYEAYFYNDMQDDLNVIFVKALREAAEQPMEKAAEILWNALDKVMEGEIEEDDDEGFFAGAMEGNPMAQQMMEQAQAQAQAMQQKMAAAMGGDEIQELQRKMTEAMTRGDMAEYMRLAGELQQKMMSGLFNN